MAAYASVQHQQIEHLCLREDLYVCYCLHIAIFFATLMNSIPNLRLTDDHSTVP